MSRGSYSVLARMGTSGKLLVHQSLLAGDKQVESTRSSNKFSSVQVCEHETSGGSSTEIARAAASGKCMVGSSSVLERVSSK
jgi:hypothetical protein